MPFLQIVCPLDWKRKHKVPPVSASPSKKLLASSCWLLAQANPTQNQITTKARRKPHPQPQRNAEEIRKSKAEREENTGVHGEVQTRSTLPERGQSNAEDARVNCIYRKVRKGREVFLANPFYR